MVYDVFCVDVDLEKVDNVEFFQKEGQRAGRQCRLSFFTENGRDKCVGYSGIVRRFKLK